MNKSPVVGVLALQGDYQKHQKVLASIGITAPAVRTAGDFNGIDRLIIPGGESSVIFDLLDRLNMRNRLGEFVAKKPVYGTCAGMILLAAEISNDHRKPFAAIDITVDRNGYGRQVFSTVSPARINVNGHAREMDLVFIRAPRVSRVGGGVRVLGYWGDDPVLLEAKNILVSSFHPELTDSTLLHEYFAFKFKIK